MKAIRSNPIIFVDYNNLPMRCRHCMATIHLVKDCHGMRGNGIEAKSSNGDLSNKEVNLEGSSSNISKDGPLRNSKGERAKIEAEASWSETILDLRSRDL